MVMNLLCFCKPTTTTVSESVVDEVGFSILPDDEVIPKCKCPMNSFNEPLKDGKCPKCGGV